jgi:hypothetical protein
MQGVFYLTNLDNERNVTMKYPAMLTVKTTRELNRTAADLAKDAGRNRSQYIRDVIKTLHHRPDVCEVVNKALGPS